MNCRLSAWFQIKRLSLNVKTTNFILFRNKTKLIKGNVNKRIHDIDISRVTSTKFLDVISNDTLTWNNHMKIKVYR